MANPKYAGLPGIAPPDEKDVYETDDLPEADQEVEHSEAESENIERPHLDITSAHSKFKDKFIVCGKNVDFSDKYRRGKNTGYKAISGEWEIAGNNEPETIFQKCNRLQLEFQEVLEAISKLKEQGNEEKDKELELVEPMVPQLQNSLQQINTYLNVSDSSDNNFTKFLSDPQEIQIQSLLCKLEQLKSIGGNVQKSGKTDSTITYHLQAFPAQTNFVQTARLANLEQRINKLETVVGITPENLNRLVLSDFKSLCQAAKELSAKVNLLDSAYVDKIDGKLGALLAKMDHMAEKRGGLDMISKEKKVHELYETLSKTEVLNHSVKSILERLIALKSLHIEASEFKKTLQELEADQTNFSVAIANNEAALNAVKDSLERHLQVIVKNIESFDNRLTSFKKSNA